MYTPVGILVSDYLHCAPSAQHVFAFAAADRFLGKHSIQTRDERKNTLTDSAPEGNESLTSREHADNTAFVCHTGGRTVTSSATMFGKWDKSARDKMIHSD